MGDIIVCGVKYAPHNCDMGFMKAITIGQLCQVQQTSDEKSMTGREYSEAKASSFAARRSGLYYLPTVCTMILLFRWY